jgi:diadenosine tetraphosphate (Ap4A) HIT family hydrolase
MISFPQELPMTQDFESCFFCPMPPERTIAKNELAYAIRDGFPVTPLHMLVIPRRHVGDYFGLTKDELLACHDLIHRVREMVLSEDTTVAGFNIGVNTGAAAGQTILHCHFHLIPRRSGDVENPRGGVRNVIPGKGDYLAM